MKEVAHGIDKNSARLSPAQRDLKGMFVKRHAEAVGVIRAASGFQTASHPFGIAVLAACADFGAAGDRIPGGFSPFDL